METRLNKYIGESGFCSRREADRLIAEGRVTINGLVAELGTKVLSGDEVKVDGKLVRPQTHSVYIAFHKPVGITCTTDTDIEGNIIDYIGYPERIFPIGRLDKPSEGLIFLTNDGDIVNKILRAANYHEKEYIVTVNQPIDKDFLDKMRNGVPILDTVTRKCVVEKIHDFSFKIILTQGLNRQIRRMCEYLGYRVVRLQRIRIMNLHLGNLKEGKWRHFTEKEIETLQKLVMDSHKTAVHMDSPPPPENPFPKKKSFSPNPLKNKSYTPFSKIPKRRK